LFVADDENNGLRIDFYNGQNFEKPVTNRIEKLLILIGMMVLVHMK